MGRRKTAGGTAVPFAERLKTDGAFELAYMRLVTGIMQRVGFGGAFGSSAAAVRYRAALDRAAASAVNAGYTLDELADAAAVALDEAREHRRSFRHGVHPARFWHPDTIAVALAYRRLRQSPERSVGRTEIIGEDDFSANLSTYEKRTRRTPP